jgi:hypothetical protein
MTFIQKHTCLMSFVSLFSVTLVSAKPPVNKEAKAVAKTLPKVSFKGGDPNRAGSEI